MLKQYAWLKKELINSITTITKKDNKKILKLENESPNVKIQKELEKVKNELNKWIKAEYDTLQSVSIMM